MLKYKTKYFGKAYRLEELTLYVSMFANDITFMGVQFWIVT